MSAATLARYSDADPAVDADRVIALTRFDTILFDLNGTLAERFDRFGPAEDYHATYRRLGGQALSAETIRERVTATLRTLLPRYASGPPDPFPDLVDCLPPAARRPPGEARLLLETMARHECGDIPAARADLLRRLAASHRLGLISDLWAPADRCRAYLDEVGLTPLFGSLVFSSDEGAVKPAPRLFHKALGELDADPARTLYVGDDLRRDIAGAAACDLRTAWIGDPAVANEADWVLRDVLELDG